jgi:hypothetical protein
VKAGKITGVLLIGAIATVIVRMARSPSRLQHAVRALCYRNFFGKDSAQHGRAVSVPKTPESISDVTGEPGIQ